MNTHQLGWQRHAGWTRLSRGLHVPTASRSRIGDLRAWSELLPAGAAFTHLTAAQHFGWWLPEEIEHPVFAAALVSDTVPVRRGLMITRHTTCPGAVTRDGLRFSSPAQTLLAAARDLDVLDLVITGDSAMRRRDCTIEDLSAVACCRRRGVRMLRTVIPLLDERSESAWESVMRVLHRAADIEVEPQYEIFDAWCRFVARADLRIKGTRRIQEYDGAEHRQRGRHLSDLDRDRRLLEAGWQRCGYSRDSVLHEGGMIIASVDRLLGRPWDPGRLRRWDALVEQSLFGNTGRARARDRWRRFQLHD